MGNDISRRYILHTMKTTSPKLSHDVLVDDKIFMKTSATATDMLPFLSGSNVTLYRSALE